MPWSEDFGIDHQEREVTLRDTSNGADPSSACTASLSKLIDTAIEKDVFVTLKFQHSEMFPILGAKCPVHIERFAGDLFGITGRGGSLDSLHQV